MDWTFMIGMVHGYGLGGSGSNLWTREAVSALCNNGETVHLMCQEPYPDRYDFVTELLVYDADGMPEQRFERQSDRPGRCIVHKPRLDVLPTYVRPDRPSDYVRSILDLDDAVLEDYVERNRRALRTITREQGVPGWHVNHTVLLSESLRRLKEEDGTPYAVMPHGSALEYVVQYDPRMKAVALQVLESADRVFSLNQEIRERLARYFPDLELEPKTVTVRVGVDTERFQPVATTARPASVERLAAALAGIQRGRGPEHGALLREAADSAADHEAFRSRVESAAQPEGPDTDVEDKLRAIHWDREPIITFVGRLIPAKGVAALVAAFPVILRHHPEARLVLVGSGWLRDYLEAFLQALGQGDGERAYRFMKWAAEREQEGARPSATAFLNRLRDAGEFEAYVRSASSRLTDDRVVFTGFLEHHLLAHVFPLADVAVFPSAVAEASPLVIPEAAACACLPMGTYFAGMRHSLDSLAPRLPPLLRPLMRLRAEPEHTATDIADNVTAALDADADYRTPLRAAAVEEYDWRGIAQLLASEVRGLSKTQT
jgi:glycosyltransferase involved in cell wall biosynthesis